MVSSEIEASTVSIEFTINYSTKAEKQLTNEEMSRTVAESNKEAGYNPNLEKF